MKNNELIIGAVVLIVILVATSFYFYRDNGSSIKEWIINMDYAVPSDGVSGAIALPKECYEGEPYNSPISRDFIANSADYIVNVRVNNIKIDGDKRTFYLDFLNLKKGTIDFVPETLKISNPYNPSIEDNSPFQRFKIGGEYNIYLREFGFGDLTSFDFVCGIEGIEELQVILPN